MPESNQNKKKPKSLLPLLLALGLIFIVGNLIFAVTENIKCWGLKIKRPESFEFASLDSLLAKHVKYGLVDYELICKDPDFEACYEELKECSPENLKGKLETLAFWINTYNFLVIKCICKNYPTEQLRQEAATEKFIVGGKVYTLKQIKEEIFPDLILSSDWRAVFLLCDGKVSSPFIAPHAYSSSKLSDEFEPAVKDFVLRKSNYKIDEKNKIFSISPFYRWNLRYIDSAYPSAFAMVNSHLPADKQLDLSQLELNYSLPFDRRINDLSLLKKERSRSKKLGSD